jgi:hypothetical protein
VAAFLILNACQLQTTTPTPILEKDEPIASATKADTQTPLPSETNTPEPSAIPATATSRGVELSDLGKGINPLTGLAVDDLTLLDRRPVGVKITLYPRTNRPQWGHSKADHVFEYYHNNELTRFHAVFYGENADLAGPIRSARLPDEYLMNAYGSSMAFASADSRIWEQLRNSFPSWKLVSIMEGECPPRPTCRYLPESFNHLLTNTSGISEYIEDVGGNNQLPDLAGMSFSEQKPKSNDEVEQINLRYSYAAYSYWDYDESNRNYVRYQDAWDDVGGRGAGYIRLTDRLNGQVITSDNVVVLYVKHFHFVYKAANNGLPATEIVDMDLGGRGEAYAFRNGLAYELEWVRNRNGVFRLEFENGEAYDFKPGNTWFQVMTEDSQIDVDEDTWSFDFVFKRP